MISREHFHPRTGSRAISCECPLLARVSRKSPDDSNLSHASGTPLFYFLQRGEQKNRKKQRRKICGIPPLASQRHRQPPRVAGSSLTPDGKILTSAVLANSVSLNEGDFCSNFWRCWMGKMPSGITVVDSPLPCTVMGVDVDERCLTEEIGGLWTARQMYDGAIRSEQSKPEVARKNAG